MRRGFGCLALAAFMLVSSAITVHAEDYKGKDGWKAEFTGTSIDSNFTSKAFAEEVTGLLPGDSIEIRVAVKNSSDRDTDWYMSNAVLQSLEDSNSLAGGGAYTYVLTYVNSKGEPTTLYSSESVGGEKASAAGVGLHEATDNLEEFFYLDRLGKRDQGYITLKVALNGETQGNAYQNTLARLQLNFAVEGTAEGGGSGSTQAGTRITGGVQTGDPGGLVKWSLIMLISGLILLICAVMYQKKSRGGEVYE